MSAETGSIERRVGDALFAAGIATSDEDAERLRRERVRFWLLSDALQHYGGQGPDAVLIFAERAERFVRGGVVGG